MIITYALGKGYTAYGHPIRNTLSFRSLTGYHSTPQAARNATKAWTHGERFGMGTHTARLSGSRPEFQDPNHRHKPSTEFISMDFSDIEARILSHYPQEMTATEAAEARDKFNEAYPKIKQFWEDIKPDYLDHLKAQTDGLDPHTYQSLFMQHPEPVEDQRKPAAGRRALYTEEQREALRIKAAQRRPK